MLILPDVDLILFITFITSCKTSSITIWFVLAAGLAENLTQVVFRQPFVIQHVRTRFLSCETWNFLLFMFFSSPYHQLVIFDVIVFPLAAFVLFRDLSRKNAWLNHTIPAWAQFCCKMCGGQLGGKPIYSSGRCRRDVLYIAYIFPILFLGVFWKQQ